MASADKFKFFIKRLRERLWVKPLIAGLMSVAGVLVAKSADRFAPKQGVPQISEESIESFLSIMAASMLVIATFAVASMVAAYASAGVSATPRSFALILADDVSQNALSTFVGAFIFSIVGLNAAKNDYFQEAGRASLFALTVLVFAWVIFTFVKWVDRIARLGRLGTSVEKVEAAAKEAISHRRKAPYLRGVPAQRSLPGGKPVYASTVGYVQRVDIPTLQTAAEMGNARVTIAALPGTFASPGRVLAYVLHDAASDFEMARFEEAFVIGRDRLFDEDPRFGLVVLSEIAAKALSPAVNDPGTAIGVIGSLIRLFDQWAEYAGELPPPKYDRVYVPELSTRDMFDDAFTAIARDGAGTVEVGVRLQKALQSLSSLGHQEIIEASRAHSRLALARAEKALDLPHDLERIREIAVFAESL